MILLWPVYYTGDPLEPIESKSRWSLDALTVLNVTANNGKLVYIYFVAMFIIPISVFSGIYWYRGIVKKWQE